jgi:hypothetical protein
MPPSSEVPGNDARELWVLTFVVDDSDPDWDECMMIVGTSEQLTAMFDLSRLPPSAQVLKGKEARDYLAASAKHEAR